jgi:lipoprotein LprG
MSARAATIPAMTNRTRWAAALLAGSVLILATGCTSSTGGTTATAVTPSAATLLSESAAAMASVTSAGFELNVDGDLPSVPVQKATGRLTANGDAQGSGTISQLGQLVEVEFVLTGGELYLKGATGGFTKVPSALAGALYDPSVILNPDKGVAKVLSSTQGATVTGTDGNAWLVSGTVPASVAGGLIPGITSDVTAVLTIDMTTQQLTAATLTLTGANGQPATVTVKLSDINEPVTITPPG